MFPEHRWNKWKFRLPAGFWKIIDNHKDFLDWSGKELGHKEWHDWYKVTMNQICEHGGQELLLLYGNSPAKALQNVYPQHNWECWKFHLLPRGFWANIDNHKQFLHWPKSRLGYKTMEDWYQVTSEDIESNGGGSLLSEYQKSPAIALQQLFPEHSWLPWRFKSIPKTFWLDPANQRMFLDWLGKELRFKNKEDWMRLRKEDVIKHGGHGLLKRYYNGSPLAALRAVYGAQMKPI